MPTSLRALLLSLRRALWTNGAIYGERLKHSVDADGAHRIGIVLRANEVVDDLPKAVVSGAALLGHSAGGGGTPSSED